MSLKQVEVMGTIERLAPENLSSTSRRQHQHHRDRDDDYRDVPNNDRPGERLRLYVEENFHDA